MKKLIYIAGRGHSGSTLLDLMLSGHSRLIGVGEVYSLFDRQRNFLNRPAEVRCSCGQQLNDCDFWGRASEDLRALSAAKASEQELYRAFLATFHDYFGPEAVPVDISKTDEALNALKTLEDADIKVIFLIRDVRSWTISMRDTARRSQAYALPDLLRRYGWRAAKPFIGRTSSKFFWHWYLLNRRTQQLLRENGLSTLQVGYEELCLYPELMMKKISEFLEIEYSESMLKLTDTQSHVILGNRMRSQQEKRSRVAYDDRWFYRLDWMGPAVLFPHIMRYNSREVYANIRDGLWNT